MITKPREDTLIGMCVEKSIYCPKPSLQKYRLVDGAFSPDANAFSIIQRLVYMTHQTTSTIDGNIAFVKMLIVFAIPDAKYISNSAMIR